MDHLSPELISSILENISWTPREIYHSLTISKTFQRALALASLNISVSLIKPSSGKSWAESLQSLVRYCPRISNLSFHRANLTAQDLPSFSYLVNLHGLSLERCYSVQGGLLGSLLQDKFLHIERFVLVGCPKVSLNEFLPRLRMLCLTNSSSCSADIPLALNVAPAVAHLPFLTFLFLGGSKGYDWDSSSLEPSEELFRSLRVVEVTFCFDFPSAAGRALSQHIRDSLALLSRADVQVWDYADIRTLPSLPDFGQLRLSGGNDASSSFDFAFCPSLLCRSPDPPITALHLATLQGDISLVRWLVAVGAPVDERDSKGCTSLFRACQSDLEEIVQILLEHGASPVVKNNNHDTPMYISCLKGHLNIVSLLLRYIRPLSSSPDLVLADVDRKLVDGFGGWTPLHAACVKGDLPLVQLLLAHGSSTDSVNEFGQTPLHICSSLGKVQAMELLVQAGASVTVRDHQGDSPLDVARKRAQQPSIDFLHKFPQAAVAKPPQRKARPRASGRRHHSN